MTFTQIQTRILNHCNLTSTEASTRVGISINNHYRRITSLLGLNAARFVTRSTSMTVGVSTVIFTEIEKIDRVRDASDASAIRVLSEVSMHALRTKQPHAAEPLEWALQNTDADSVTILTDTVPQDTYDLQADGWTTLSDLSGADEPIFPESFHDILTWFVIAEELLKKEKDKLAFAYEQKAEKLLSDLRFHLADSPMLETRQASSGASATSGSSGGGGANNGGDSYTQTGLITFDRDPSAPFAVTSSSAKVSNLDADLLDGKDWDSNLHLSGAVGVGIANQADVQLQVTRAAGTTLHKTAQIDMNVVSGSGATHTGLQVNCRTTAGSTWTGTGGFLYGMGIEAGIRVASVTTVMGLNVQGKIWDGGTGNSLNVMEINACSTEPPTTRSLLTLSPVPHSEALTTENDPASGSIDTAILVSAKRYGAKLATGIHFYQPAGAEAATGFRWPIQTTGTLILATPGEAVSIAAGIDLTDSDLTITGNAFASTGFSVTGAGIQTLTRASALTTAQLRLIDTSTGDTTIQFSVGGVASWFVGIDNSDSDKLKIGTSEGFGSGVLAVIDTSGNLGLGVGTFGTNAAGVIGLTNGTAPTTSPADMVQIFSVDAAATEATLGLRTEAAVVTESVTSDRTLKAVINGTVYKICLKS